MPPRHFPSPCQRLILLIGALGGLLVPWSLADRSGSAGVAAPTLSVWAAQHKVPGVEKPSLPALHRARHLKRLGVDAWHAAGQRGRGIKVAVLDSGFAGYQAQLGKSLPRRVNARSFRFDDDLEAKDSQHGILCAEAVHALAPEAELLFANWEPNHPGQFLEAVRWAVGEGARVLSCSIIMPTWSDGEGGGPVHAELARVLGDGSRTEDALFFACAGNTADRHWGGPFRAGSDGWHTWGEGCTDNPVLPWGTGRVSVELCVEDDADLELSVYDATAEQDVRRSSVRRGDYRCAVVRFHPQAGHSYRARVRATGTRTSRFHLFVLGGGLGQPRSAGSIPFPGDGTEVVTVGAVDTEGCRAGYSSCGPNSSQPKPDLVAPVPFVSLFRSRPFAGTSAAAPQAAGLAAVLWGRTPAQTARQVVQTLRRSAIDLGPRGHDWETGHGLAHLPASR